MAKQKASTAEPELEPELELEPKPPLAWFRLNRAFWDNTRLHAAGDVVQLEVGKEPKGSVLVELEAEEDSSGDNAEDE